MTEMVYGAVPERGGEPILPKWWRTLDKWSMSCVLILFVIGLLLGLAASPPLAARNGLEPFHYVQRQAVFGGLALIAMLLTSMMSPTLVRRLAVLGFLISFVALALAAVLRHRFRQGRGALVSLGFASVQPSEFLKPGFVVAAAWMLAASQQINGPPGTAWSFVALHRHRADAGAAARFRPGLPGAVRLGSDVFRGRRADAPAGRDGRSGGAGRHDGLFQFRAFRPPHRRVSLPRGRSRPPSSAMPPTRSARAGFSASASARGR